MNFIFGYGLGAALATAFATIAMALDMSWWVIAPIIPMGLVFIAWGVYDAKQKGDEQ
jgi:hypothetical protein